MARRIWCVLCAGMVLLCWVFWPQRAKVVAAEEYLSSTRHEFQGVVEVWQVSGFRTATMARSTAIEQAIERFETQNAGVYVEFEEITAETLENRIKIGWLPDLLSVPGNVSVPMENLMDLGRAGADEIFRGDWGKALPWMASAGIIIRREETMEGAVGAAQWMSGFALAGTELGALRTVTDREAHTQFINGKAGLWYAGLWEEASLARREEPIEYQIFPWPQEAYLPVQFQYLIAYQPKTQGREDVIRSLCGELLNEKTQKTVTENCGLLPIISPGEDWNMNEAQKTAWERLSGAYCYLAPGAGVKDEVIVSGQNLTDFFVIVPEALRRDGE